MLKIIIAPQENSVLINRMEEGTILKGSIRSIGMKIYNAAIILYLNNKGIKKSNKGYIFLVDAIRLGAESPNALSRVTDLYTIIAMSYGTEPHNVERGIRYAISGLGATNKEFISCAVDEMIRNYTVTGAVRKMICNKPH